MISEKQSVTEDESALLKRIAELEGTVSSLSHENERLRSHFGEDSLETIFRIHTMDAFRLTDKDGTVINVNEPFCRLFEKTYEECIGMHFTEVYDEAAKERLIESNRKWWLNCNSFFNKEYNFTVWNGKKIICEVSASSIRLNDRLFMFTIIHDISPRKFLEEELRGSVDFFRTFIERLPIALFAKDAEKGTFMLWNKHAETVFGLPEEAVLGKTDFDLFPKDQAELFRSIDEWSLTTGEIIDIPEEEVLTPKKGRQFHHTIKIPVFDKNHKPLSIIGFSRDITDQKFAEENTAENERKLRESEAKFRSYFELPLVGIAISGPDRNLQDVNEKFCSLFGYSRDEILRKSWHELTHPEDIDKNYEFFHETVSGRRDGYIMQKRYVRRNGTVMHANLSVRCQRKPDRSIDYFISLVQDITKEHEAVEALKLSEANMRAILNSSLQSFILIDKEKRVLAYNENSVEYVKTVFHDTLQTGISFLRYVLPDDRQNFIDYFESCIGGVPQTVERSIPIDGGVLAWYEYHFDPVRSVEGKIEGVSLGLLDISDRKLNEGALRLTQFMIDKATIGVVRVRITGEIDSLNDGAAVLLEKPKEELLGHKLYEVSLAFSDEDWDSRVNRLRLYKELSQDFYLRSGGGERFIKVQSNYLRYGHNEYIIIYALDISDRKRAEDALRESERKYGLLVENAPIGIVLINTRGDTLYSNDAFREIVDNRSFSEFTDANLLKTMSSEMRQKIQTCVYTGENFSFESQSKKLSGEDIHLHTILTPIKEERGIVKSILIMMQNITTRKEAEAQAKMFTEALRASKESLEKQATELLLLNDKLRISEQQLRETNDRKDRFFSLLAHDLKGPFQGLIGFTSLLSERFETLAAGEVRQYIEIVKQQSNTVYSLIENLLEWTRMQLGRYVFEPKHVLLSAIVQESIDPIIGAAQKKNIEISVAVPAEMIIYADRKMVRSVLQNLVSNAIKFSFQNSTIFVSAEEKNAFIFISVKDTGIGIKENDKDKLFKIDVVHSTSGTDQEQGTGLGLILCKEMIEKHSGTITFEGKSGEGTTFIVKLPKPASE